eukprot:jgi/Mesvir1/23281/Mv20983-RA.1
MRFGAIYWRAEQAMRAAAGPTVAIAGSHLYAVWALQAATGLDSRGARSVHAAMASAEKCFTPGDDPRGVGKIRVTPDGRVAIQDFIACVLYTSVDGTSKLSARDMSSKMCTSILERHPEFVVDTFPFSRRGSKTRVVTFAQLQAVVCELPFLQEDFQNCVKNASSWDELKGILLSQSSQKTKWRWLEEDFQQEMELATDDRRGPTVNDDPRGVGKIRVTPGGRISVIDAITYLLYLNPDGTPKPRARDAAGARLSSYLKRHPGVCFERFRFPGFVGGHGNPVATVAELKDILCYLVVQNYDLVTSIRNASTWGVLESIILANPSKCVQYTLTEKDIKQRLAAELGAQMEVRCKFGVIDILSEKAKFLMEVKVSSAWMEALGQLLVYGSEYPDYEKRMHLFTTPRTAPLYESHLLAMKEVCDMHGIEITLEENVEVRPSLDEKVMPASSDMEISGDGGSFTLDRAPQNAEEIRVTPDGMISVYDALSFLYSNFNGNLKRGSALKMARQALLCFKKQHPEVAIGYFNFSRAQGRETPVATFAVLKAILCDLPNLHYNLVTSIKSGTTWYDLKGILTTQSSRGRRRKSMERDIQQRLAGELGGQMEVRCKHGVIDILVKAEKVIVELKEFSAWMEALGQLLAYGSEYPDYKKRMHLFMTSRSPRLFSSRLVSMKRICRALGIEISLEPESVIHRLQQDDADMLVSSTEVAGETAGERNLQAAMELVEQFRSSNNDSQVAGKIRETPDGRLSIIDVIVCLWYTNPDGTLKPDARPLAAATFRRFLKKYPEVVVDKVQLPGPWGRVTPVATVEQLKNILRKLPLFQLDFVTSVDGESALDDSDTQGHPL